MHRFIGWLRARLATQDLGALAFTVWVAGLTLTVHLRFIEHAQVQNMDEGYVLAIGMRMLKGHMLPYVDGVAHTGPLFLYTGALLAALKPFSWVPIRVAAGLTYAAIPVLLFASAREARRSLAGALAGVAIPVVTLLRWPPLDGVAYNAETPEVLCTLGALYCVLRSVKVPSRGWSAAAGVFTAGITLSKQVGVLQAAVIAVGFLLALFARSELSNRQRLQLLAIYVAASLLPLLALATWLGIHGALADAYYYLVTYNREVYMYHLRNVELAQPWRDWLIGQPLELTLLVAAIAWGLAQAALAWSRRRPDALFPLLIAGLVCTGIIAARASQRDFSHYYLMAIPWLAMLLGMMVEQSLAVVDGRRLALAFLLVPIVGVVTLIWWLRKDTLLGWSDQEQRLVPLAEHGHLPRVCTIVNAHSKPDDTLFVWGFRAELYVSCRRWPASRFVFSTFVSGFVPWNFAETRDEENQLAVPGSRARLISELEATKPPVIIDAPLSMGGRTMTAYPETGVYLRSHYRLLSNERDLDVWVREGS